MALPFQRQDRFHYSRIDSKRDYCGHVIVELGNDPLDEQRWEFFDKEYGSVRWLPFEPENVEIEEVKRLVSQRRNRSTDGAPTIDVAKLREKSPFSMAAPAIATVSAMSAAEFVPIGVAI